MLFIYMYINTAFTCAHKHVCRGKETELEKLQKIRREIISDYQVPKP